MLLQHQGPALRAPVHDRGREAQAARRAQGARRRSRSASATPCTSSSLHEVKTELKRLAGSSAPQRRASVRRLIRRRGLPRCATRQRRVRSIDSRRRSSLGRGVAQPGSAPALGAGGRWFESSRPDHFSLAGQPSRPIAADRLAAILPRARAGSLARLPARRSHSPARSARAAGARSAISLGSRRATIAARPRRARPDVRAVRPRRRRLPAPRPA